MKKLLFLFGIVFATVTANAAYLYWQVADYKESPWNAVGVYLYNKTTQQVVYNTPLQIVTGDTTTDLLQNPVAESQWVAIMDDKYANSKDPVYSYYVEYYNYDSTKPETLLPENKVAGGIVETPTYYDSTSSSAQLPSSAWATPSTYTAVPEPTSGLLLMFGAAMLGLKRKNRSRA